MSKTMGLGRGVGALFNQDEEKEKYFDCAIDSIEPSKYQPRSFFDEESLGELADSIKEKGIIQPLIVTSVEGKGKYSLIAGERRLRASKIAGLKKVPVIVRKKETNDSLLELALIENIQRKDLSAIEEAEAYQQLIKEFGLTQEQTAKKVGKKRSTVTNLLRLLQLPEYVQDDLSNNRISEGHARVLLRLSDRPVEMKDLRDLIIEKQLSVRQSEKLSKKASSSGQGVVNSVSPVKNEDELSRSYCQSLTNQLTNALQSKAVVCQNGSRGKIEIEYYSVDDLERLIATIVKD